MSADFQILTVMSAIADFSISGVTVMDADEIPFSAKLQPGILYPNVDAIFDQFTTDIETLGVSAEETIANEYDLSYRFLYCTPNSVGGMYNVAGLLAAVRLIAIAFMTNDTVSGAEDLRLVGITKPGKVLDPAENVYIGCDFILHIIEQGAP